MAIHTVPKSGEKLGASPRGAPSEVDVRGELVVEILPRGYVRWSGTVAQLVAEGLLPEWFGPDCKNTSWDEGRFEFCLTRGRPSHVPYREWRAGARDYWHLERSLKSSSGCFWDDARLFDKQQALASELWSRTPAGAIQKHLLVRAVEDTRFQAFLSLVGATPARNAIG
jgi:hypothetical protein